VNATLKKILRYTVFIGISAFFIYLAFNKTKPGELIEKIASGNLAWVFAAIAAGFISCISRAVRWQILAEPLGYKTSLATTYHGIMVGYMVNFAIPRGGEVARAAVVSRAEKIPMTTMVGTIVAERLVDLLCMGIVLLLAIGLQFDILKQVVDLLPTSNPEKGGLSIMQTAGIVVAVLGILFFAFRKKIAKLAFYQKVLGFVKGFANGIRSLTKIKKPFWFIFHSVVIWVMYYLMVFLCFYALPQTSHLGISAGLTVLVMSTVAILLPAPGGMGTFHFFVSLSLTLYGITRDDGVVYATIAHASQMIMFLVLGAISMVALLIQQRKQLAGETAAKNTAEINQQ
jgi:uncharacterized membrane protein YbhN (UPF0104 family)